MDNKIKSPTSPDSVLSLVVFILSLFLIMSAASLYYFQTNISYAGASIGMVANKIVEQLQVERQAALETLEPDSTE